MVDDEFKIVEILRFFQKSAQSRMMALDEKHQKIWWWIWKMLTSRESTLFSIIVSFSIVVGVAVNVWLQELNSLAGILVLWLVVIGVILLTTSVGIIILASWTAPGFEIERMISAGRVYLESGHPQAAIRAFDEVLRLDRNLGEAYRNRGLAEAMMGDYEAAVEGF